MSRQIRLAIIHSNRLFQDCLVAVLSSREHLEVVGFIVTDPGFLQSLLRHSPHAILIEVNLPDPGAADLARRIRQDLPNTKVLVLTSAYAQDHLLECLAAGVHGCVLEESSVDELQFAIEAVAAGESFCSPKLAFSMCNRLATAARFAPPPHPTESFGLTPRELQIIELIADGRSNKEIAKLLSVSLHTVKQHVHNLISKLQVGDRFEAVRLVRQRCGLQAAELAGVRKA